MRRWLALLSTLLAIAAAPEARAATSFWYRQVVTGPTPSDVVRRYEAPAATIGMTLNAATVVEVSVQGGNEFSFLRIRPPQGQLLQPIGYEEPSTTNGLDPKGTMTAQLPTAGCQAPFTARFSVLDVAIDATNHVTSLAVDFEQRCGNGYTYGELRIASALPLTLDKAPTANVPDPFGFPPLVHAGFGRQTVSAATTIYGMRAPAPILVTGGEYSLNGGPFTSSPGFAANGDRLRLRVVTPTAPLSTAAVTVMVGGVSVPFLATTHDPTVPDRVVAVEVVGFGTVPSTPFTQIRAPYWQLSSQSGVPLVIQADVQGAIDHTVWLAPPYPETTFRQGAYEIATPHVTTGASPSAMVYVGGRYALGCEPVSARLVILEAEYGVVGGVVKATKLAANYEQHCADGSALYGEVRYDSLVPLREHNTAPVSMPEPFSLGVKGPVPPASTITSNTITVLGVTTPVPISISGGEYSVNGGAFTAAPALVNKRDRVMVRVVSSALPGAIAQAALTIGGRTSPLHAITYTPGEVLGGAYLRGAPGHVLLNGDTRYAPTPPNILGFQMLGNRLEVTLATLGGERYQLYFSAAYNQPLAVGTHEFAGLEMGSPRLDIYTDRTCAGQGRFVVRDLLLAADGSPLRFAIDFVHTCDGAQSPLAGEIRYNSQVPFAMLVGASLPSCVPGDADGDGISDCLELDLGTNPATRDNDVFVNRRFFVAQQYRDFLAREGDTAGIDFWVARLAGGLSSSLAVQDFFLSPEFQDTAAPIARLYFAYFGRYPDYGGLRHWERQSRYGFASLYSISYSFAQGAEFAQTYGPLTNSGFVDRVYRNVLGRAPDSDGLAFWTGRIASGEMTRGDVMLSFSESPEFRRTIDSEVFVTMIYAGMLRREPDSAGFNYWVAFRDRNPQAVTMIDLFMGSAEYRSRFLP